MKRMLLAVAFGFAAMPAFAGTMDASFGNTMFSSTAAGQTSNWYFNKDGTYTMKGADGAAGAGTWALKGGQICTTPTGGAEACYKYVDGKKVGDSWSSTDASGTSYTVGLKAGR